MAAPKKPFDQNNAPGFDVTCVIGRVTLDDNGMFPPHVAASHLIAEHDAPGIYTFPGPGTNSVCRVTVEYDES